MALKIAGLALILIGSVSAAAVAPQAFSLTRVVNRFVTPNGDGKNDLAFFQYSNANQASGTLRIFELRGRQVASVALDPEAQTVFWDPRGYANGIYIYVLTVDQTSKSGVLVVVR